MNRSSSCVIVLTLLAFVQGCGAQAPSGGVRRDIVADAGAVREIRGMTRPRSAHTATLLRDGKVLIAGGYIGGDGNMSSAELFDPAATVFTAVGNMTAERSSHTATLLPSGKVLIAGGFNGGYLDSAEIYDPATKRFAPAGRMTTPRSGHAATVLTDGKILFVGGVGTGWTFLKSAELYDPVRNGFTAVGEMTVPRESHTATLLNDGTVLVAGGHSGRRSSIAIYTSTEIFDPRTNRFSVAGDLTIKRHKHEATRLNDGRILILGGSDERDGNGAYDNAEVYEPANGRFTALKNSMQTARYKLQGTGILLPSGKVLVAGGSDRAEVFDPETNSFSYAGGELGTKRLFATATLLPNGTVLITGGYHSGNAISAGAWIYQA